jgi:hypothetical protein
MGLLQEETSFLLVMVGWFAFVWALGQEYLSLPYSNGNSLAVYMVWPFKHAATVSNGMNAYTEDHYNNGNKFQKKTFTSMLYIHFFSFEKNDKKVCNFNANT